MMKDGRQFFDLEFPDLPPVLVLLIPTNTLQVIILLMGPSQNGIYHHDHVL